MAFANRDVANGILIVGIHNAGALAINDVTIATDPANRPIFADWPAPARTWKSPGNTAYYVDSSVAMTRMTARAPRTPGALWTT